MIELIMRKFASLHLWVGEVLGFTHYRNCYRCKYCVPSDEMGFVWCSKYVEEEGCMAATNSSEAVWCHDFEAVETEVTE